MRNFAKEMFNILFVAGFAYLVWLGFQHFGWLFIIGAILIWLIFGLSITIPACLREMRDGPIGWNPEREPKPEGFPYESLIAGMLLMPLLFLFTPWETFAHLLKRKASA